MRDKAEGDESIGSLIRRLRDDAGLSQAELAARAGLSDGMIGNVERGTRNLGTESLSRVADVLGASPADRAALYAARDRMAGQTAPLNPNDNALEKVLTQLTEMSAALREQGEVLHALAQLIERRMPRQDQT